MLSILDRYILKRYIGTFALLLLLFIPIGITVNLAEKIDKILQNEAPFLEVVEYYIYFTIYFANLLFPLFLFLSVIWFTSKLANNTEVIAFLSSGVSYYRFLRPYFIGATIVCIGALIMGMYLAPLASKGFNEFINYSEAMSPLGNATALDCANYCVAMFSDLTRYVTMQNLFHDGGFSNTGVTKEVIDKFSD